MNDSKYQIVYINKLGGKDYKIVMACSVEGAIDELKYLIGYSEIIDIKRI